MAEREINYEGKTLIVNDDRRSLQFNIKDLFRYRLMESSSDIIEGQGVFVAREDDSILSFDAGFYRVGHVDQTTYVADLYVWDKPDNPGDVDGEDMLLGLGPGRTSESYRVYLDTRVFPYKLDINSRQHSYGDQAKSVMVFKGTNTNKVTGDIISAYYDQNGEYVGPEIPLSLAWTKDSNNKAVWAPKMGYTTRELDDGQLVTVVTYNTEGSPTDEAKMLIHNTNNVRHPEDDMERIESIDLISPYLSATEPNTLYVPINATKAQLAMRAKVTYTSGRYSIQDVVDETAAGKFKLLGLQNWSPSISGVPQEVDLSYELTPDSEYSYLQGVTESGRVLKAYRIIGTPFDPARALKLFAYPTWVSDLVGYDLEFWMYDLTREVAYRVPKAAVELSELSPPFDPFNFTSVQRMTFGVVLGMIDQRYGTERHDQIIQVALKRAGGQRASNWAVKFAGSQKDWYGEGLEALIRSAGAGLSTCDVSQGLETREEWLKEVFYKADPLYDPENESKAPEPTHFVLITRTQTFEVPISQWKTPVTFINDLPEGATIYLKWIRRITAGELQLATTGLPTHNV